MKRAEGPLPEWHQMDDSFDPEMDDEIFLQLYHTLILVVADTDVGEAVGEFKRILSTASSSFSSVKHTWLVFTQTIEPHEDELTDRRWQRVLTMVTDLLRLRWFFEVDDFATFGTQTSEQELRDNAWKYCSEDRRFHAWKGADYNPRAGFQDFVIIHLFSGERRDKDLEAFAGAVVVPSHCCRVVLSVDIIYDNRNANLADPMIQEKWHGFMRRGLIHVLYAGPPCETWSVARLAGGIAGHSPGDGGPRAIRTTEWTMGLPATTIQEAKQLLIGNVLLTFTLMSVLIMATLRRLAVMEHPEPSSEDWVASSWKLHATQLLLSHPFIEVYSILQGRYGGISPKPTRLLISSDSKSDVQQILDSFAVTSLPKGISLGKDTKSGEYNTAPLKNYPPLLCEALAVLAQDWCSKYYDPGIETGSDQEFLKFVERLKSSFNESAVRGPDFALHA